MEQVIRTIIYFSIFIGLFILTYYLLGFMYKKKPVYKDIGTPFITIIVPVYNEELVLEKTVDSLINLNYPKNKYEIIIVNDGSIDNTEKIARRLVLKNKIIKLLNKKNGGKASAMNLGIKNAKGQFIVSFDSDSMIIPNALKYMLPLFSDPKVMCVTPAMKVYKPKGILQRVQAMEYDLGIFLRKSFSNINSIHVTPGPFSIYRKVFFEKHGGYDENNITEDLEIAMRIQSHNYRIENSPYSLSYTLAPNTFYSLLKQRRRWYFGMIKNLTRYKFMFSRKYGELGVFIFPMAVISTLITMTITFYYAYRAVAENIKTINLYSTIGFDIMNNISYKWYSFFMSFYRILSEGILVFAIFFIITTLSIALLVNKKTSSIDKPISTFISYVFFVFLYSILFSLWWAISIIYSITGKKVEW